MSTYKVKSTALNLRSTPEVKPKNIIATLPEGHLVNKLETVAGSNWWKISTKLQGSFAEGYLNSKFVVAYTPDSTEPDAPQVLPTIPEIHLLSHSVIKRSDPKGRAYPLNEPNLPCRAAASSSDKKQQIGEIIDWLNVEKNHRYLPANGSTFCNIYAYDFCFLANAYIPRVWWTRRAIALIAAGNTQKPVYGTTVSEMNANSLCDWFEEFGPDFGWRRTIGLDELQIAANEGQVCIIVGQHTDLNRSGHICAVVPELDHKKAKRSGNASIIVPLQSQAGSKNYLYGGNAWWTGKQFRKFGFWIHA